MRNSIVFSLHAMSSWSWIFTASIEHLSFFASEMVIFDSKKESLYIHVGAVSMRRTHVQYGKWQTNSLVYLHYEFVWNGECCCCCCFHQILTLFKSPARRQSIKEIGLMIHSFSFFFFHSLLLMQKSEHPKCALTFLFRIENHWIQYNVKSRTRRAQKKMENQI